jgi:hypothetical protein
VTVPLRRHLQLFLNAYNYGRRLKTLRGLTPYEFVCKTWTEQPRRFRLDPSQHTPDRTSSATVNGDGEPSLPEPRFPLASRTTEDLARSSRFRGSRRQQIASTGKTTVRMDTMKTFALVTAALLVAAPAFAQSSSAPAGTVVAPSTAAPAGTVPSSGVVGSGTANSGPGAVVTAPRSGTGADAASSNSAASGNSEKPNEAVPNTGKGGGGSQK